MTHEKSLSQEMYEHVARQRKSGQTVAEYAGSIGISKAKFNYWIRKYKNQEIDDQDTTQFINLNSFENSGQLVTDEQAAGQARTPQVTLTLPNGLSIQIY